MSEKFDNRYRIPVLKAGKKTLSDVCDFTLPIDLDLSAGTALARPLGRYKRVINAYSERESSPPLGSIVYGDMDSSISYELIGDSSKNPEDENYNAHGISSNWKRSGTGLGMSLSINNLIDTPDQLGNVNTYLKVVSDGGGGKTTVWSALPDSGNSGGNDSISFDDESIIGAGSSSSPRQVSIPFLAKSFYLKFGDSTSTTAPNNSDASKEPLVLGFDPKNKKYWDVGQEAWKDIEFQSTHPFHPPETQGTVIYTDTGDLASIPNDDVYKDISASGKGWYVAEYELAKGWLANNGNIIRMRFFLNPNLKMPQFPESIRPDVNFEANGSPVPSFITGRDILQSGKGVVAGTFESTDIINDDNLITATKMKVSLRKLIKL